MTIERAKKMMCPFISTSCKANECMAWEATTTSEISFKKPNNDDDWKYSEVANAWLRELPMEKRQGYCKLIGTYT